MFASPHSYDDVFAARNSVSIRALLNVEHPIIQAPMAGERSLAKKGGEERGVWAMVRNERRAFCAVETAGIMTAVPRPKECCRCIGTEFGKKRG